MNYFLTFLTVDDKIFSCSDTKGSSRRKGMICFEGFRRESLRFDISTINTDFVPGNVSCHLDMGRFYVGEQSRGRTAFDRKLWMEDVGLLWIEELQSLVLSLRIWIV